jgi:hypothetical protein
LFEIGISSLKAQKNSRELEIIIRECILQTIRENIPVEELLKLYMNETVEDVVEVHEKEEIISQKPVIETPVAGSVSEPLTNDSNLSTEDKDTISKIKAASTSAASSAASNGVSFNMKNNEIIPIEKINNDQDNNDNDDYNFGDSNGDDDFDDDDDENVKLKIGDNVELSVDAFPSDAIESDAEDDASSDVDITIDEIPLLDD